MIYAIAAVYLLITGIACALCWYHGKLTGILIGREQEQEKATRRIKLAVRTRGFWI